MFKKVLIVDDHASANIGVLEVLDGLKIEKTNIQKSQYCDEAYLKIKRAILDQVPFDLVITDLQFKKDHREEKLTSGEDLIAVLRKDYPELPIIVFSGITLLQKVRLLFNNYKINAYVCKGRYASRELTNAIEKVYNKQMFLSEDVKQALSPKNDLEITDFDIELAKQLSLGKVQSQISEYFKTNKIIPSSVSSIEKRLNKLRIQFKADNATHLVAKMKDLGLI